MNKQKLENRDKPIIGIVPLVDLQRESYWMLPGYMKGIELAGGFPVMLPLTSEDEDILQMVRLCDGVLFTGGQDVEPHQISSKRWPLRRMVLSKRYIIPENALFGRYSGIRSSFF